MERICNACLCLVAVFCGCTGPQRTSKPCIGNYDPSLDYFPVKISVKYAANFDVSYHRHYKVVRTFPHSPDQDLTEASTFVLVQCGAPLPALEGELAGAFAFRIPARNVALTLNEDLAMVYLLGLAGRVVATGAPSHYPEIQEGQK